ncbi:MAG: low molecular weight protein-tyrosine-phosphatase [Planctomycetota bacterium]
MRVLFVCLGNICRSPTAEAVFRDLVLERGLGDRVEVDSCGLLDYHEGNPPDARATAAAAGRGLDLTTQRARQIEDADFEQFDLVLALDREVLRSLRTLAPDGTLERVQPFLGFGGAPGAARDVPDPYYGGAQGFEDALDLIEDGSRVLLADVEARLEAHDG